MSRKSSLISYIVLFLLGLGVGLTVPQFLSFKPPHPMEGEPFIQHFSKKFNLDKVQKKKVREIFKNGREKMQALRKEMRPKHRGIKDDIFNELSGILNEKQLKRLKKMRERMEERRKMHHKGKRRRFAR